MAVLQLTLGMGHQPGLWQGLGAAGNAPDSCWDEGSEEQGLG